MVLDAKALTWANQHNIDTGKLKAAKIPIYGKWYFPEIPPGVPLVSLQTGERQTFEQRMLAGEVIWVAEADLRRAGLLAEAEAAEAAPPAVEAEPPPPASAVRAGTAMVSAEETPEPLLAMARPPGYDEPVPGTVLLPEDVEDEIEVEQEALPGIHLPSPSIGPLVLGFGFSLTLLGVITHPLILVTGLVWMLVGAIVWIRVGLLEERAQLGDHAAAELPPELPEAAA
jgi:hypothetical protein